MPDRSNGNSQATLNSASTGTSSASSTTSNTDAPDSQNFLSPYNTNNFMAPPIGAIIRVVTCLGNTVQGKVIAYDQQAKILALRTVAPNKPGSFDYSMVNISWCSKLDIIEEPSESPEPLSNLNIQKLERRKKINIDNKKKEINSLGNDVTPLAQHLYFTILKTLNEVEWDNKNIVVMNSVVIKPPYDENCCHGRTERSQSHAIEHVKKIVKKFNEEYNVKEASPPSN